MVRKKIITGMVVAAVMLLAVFGLSVFSNSHGIPNGKYGSNMEGGAVHTKEYYSDWYWRVIGNRAYYYASGQLSYKGKIIKKDGKLYFDVYSVFCENAFEYEVEYDETTKRLTVYSGTPIFRYR
ncbi:MAG TPA: hypothetical protein GXZ92_05310 [Clostridiales bacterium]|nr:hypothetical protein [Clostridiales bacterium]